MPLAFLVDSTGRIGAAKQADAKRTVEPPEAAGFAYRRQKGGDNQPASVTNFLLRTPMHSPCAAVLPPADLTYCRVRLHRPAVRVATQDGASTPSRRKLVTDAG